MRYFIESIDKNWKPMYICYVMGGDYDDKQF